MSQYSPSKYAVLGHPISHSMSPLIHKQFADQFGFSIDYQAIDVEPGTFVETVKAFRESGGKGCNVTVPYKMEAWTLSDRRSDRAEVARAVNTLKFQEDGLIFGDNTDGIGLLRDLTQNLGCSLKDTDVLLLGAGGAVRGVLPHLLDEKPKSMTIANRTAKKAEELVKDFARFNGIVGCGLDDIAGKQFDYVINGTAADLGNAIPEIPAGLFRKDTVVYDMMYGKEPTAFMRWVQAQGVKRVTDGLGMLVEQAAESFYVWWDRRPETETVIRMLRSQQNPLRWMDDA